MKSSHCTSEEGGYLDLFRGVHGVPVMAQRLSNPISIHEDMGLIPGLARCVKDLALP